jgi:hypothetical protein
MKQRNGLLIAATLAAAMAASARAHALDKQGKAHGGKIVHDDEGGFGATGSISSGVAFFNPSYFARPDNTGLQLLRYAAHLDLDILGPRLSIPLDVNLVTDRERDGLNKTAPSEIDLIGGFTSTWKISSETAFEFGSRAQHERPVDRGGFNQTFVDVRSKFLWKEDPFRGAFALGWFAYNNTYVARPDNTGLAGLRYVAAAHWTIVEDLAFGVDTTFFTDRKTHWLRPSELDLTLELVMDYDPIEVHLAYERDMPVDRGGLVQHFAYLLFVYEFGLFKDELGADPSSRGGIAFNGGSGRSGGPSRRRFATPGFSRWRF